MLRYVLLAALTLSGLGLCPSPRSIDRREFVSHSIAGVAFVGQRVGAEEMDNSAPLPPPPPSPAPSPFPQPPPTYTLTRGFGEYDIPSIGFGLYKTSPEEAEASVAAALDAGYRHFDTALLYGNEAGVGAALSQSNVPRRKLFLTTKIPPKSKGGDVRKALKDSLKRLKTPYCDLCLVHSPIGGYQDRLVTYAALQALSEEGFCRSVGVANYGLRHLEEIQAEGLELPALVSLEISPYNQHKDVVAFCKDRGIVVACQSWSKLSGNFNWGSDADFKKLAAICAAHGGATKAQVLVKWATQSGFVALPRTTTATKAEAEAVPQNLLLNWDSGDLTKEEMDALNSLDRELPAGELGRTDGWRVEDVKGPTWDPTYVV